MRNGFTSLVVLVVAAGASACFFDRDYDYSGGGYYPPSGSSGGDSTFPTSAPRGPQPQFGATVSLDDAPPPLSGGTLTVSRDGARAVAADPDRDSVFVVDLGEKRVIAEVTLDAHDEPGRVVEDGEGRAHVVLRRGGAVATIALADGKLLARRKACAAPRGIAFDAGHTRLVVACEGGELVTLPPDPAIPGDATLLVRLDRDLRDVVATPKALFVSRFRSAELLELTHQGTVTTRNPVDRGSFGPTQTHAPMVAFRMAAPPPDEPDADPIIVHEEATGGSLSTGAGGYYGTTETEAPPCSTGTVIHSAVTRGGLRGGTVYLPGQAALPVDVASDGKTLAIVAAGNGHTSELPQVYALPLGDAPWSPCEGAWQSFKGISGQITSVAFRRANALVVQSREPAKLVFVPEGTSITLSTSRREDTGHAVFHSNAGAGAACASCHPEGGDDGRVWSFAGVGDFRTPSLRGTLAGTAPFHWAGDIASIGALADDVLSGRMSGPALDASQKDAFEKWLFSIPAPNASTAASPEAVQRGKALFERSDVACASCHSGARLTNGQTVDVGSGGYFQVPSLVGVASRAPLMHDGCAKALRDRFTTFCGGNKHGDVSGLTPTEIDDLVGYLETL